MGRMIILFRCPSHLLKALIYCSFIEGFRFPFDYLYRTCRALGKAVAEAVAVRIGYQPGLAVFQHQGSLMACVYTEPAAVAFFFVYLNYFPYHNNAPFICYQ
jgi:hypothetical protein